MARAALTPCPSPDGRGEFAGDLPRDVRHLPLEFFDPPRDLLHGRMQGRAILQADRRDAAEAPPSWRSNSTHSGLSTIGGGSFSCWLRSRLRFRSRLGHLPAKRLQPGLVLGQFAACLFGRLAGLQHGPLRATLPFRTPVLHVTLRPGVGGLLGTSAVVVGDGHRDADFAGRCGLRQAARPLDDVGRGGVRRPGVGGNPTLVSPAIDDDRRQPEHQQAKQHRRPADRPRPDRLRYTFPEPCHRAILGVPVGADQPVNSTSIRPGLKLEFFNDRSRRS